MRFGIVIAAWWVVVGCGGRVASSDESPGNGASATGGENGPSETGTGDMPGSSGINGINQTLPVRPADNTVGAPNAVLEGARCDTYGSTACTEGGLLVSCVAAIDALVWGNAVECDCVTSFGICGDSFPELGPDTDPEPPCDAPTQVFANLQPLACTLVGCHGPGSEPVTSLLLTGTTAELTERLKDQPSTSGACTGLYIDSANPDASILLLKTSDRYQEACPGTLPMPFGSTLPANDFECLRDWVYSIAGDY